MIQLLNILHTYDSLFMCLLLTCVVGWVKRLSKKALFTWADVHYATLFIFILHGVCLNVPVVLVLFVVVLFLYSVKSSSELMIVHVLIRLMCIESSYDTDVIFNLMDVMLSSVSNHYYRKKVLFFDHAQHIPLRTKTITGIIIEK